MTWELFIRLFHVDVPIELSAVVFLICCGVSVIIWNKSENSNSWNWAIFIWTMAYIFMMLYITVLSRLDSPSVDYRYNFVPLWSIGQYKDGVVETLYEKINNIILFVPMGMLVGATKRHHGFRFFNCGFRGFLMTLVLGCIVSIGIEILQLITRTGMCETDDVICNTIGCVIGYTGVQSVRLLFSHVCNFDIRMQESKTNGSIREEEGRY